MKVSATKMSSRGQVVIPEEIRKQLGLTPGMRFIVVGDGDVVVLKRLEPPSMSDFDALIAEARRAAKRAGLKPTKIEEAVQVEKTTR